MSLAAALAATAEPDLWRRYCRLAAAAENLGSEAAAAHAIGSVEWQRRQREPPASEPPLTPELEQAGRRSLAARDRSAPFAGAVSPLGAASRAAFDAFVAGRRGPAALAAEIAALERRLIDGFEALGRAGRFRASGFCGGAQRDIDPEWFGRARLDFDGDRVVLADGSVVAGVTVALGTTAAVGAPGRERTARTMLREALSTLWQRGAFTAGTGNERVLALVLAELGLDPADPPYGFKSAESVRKLRKILGMSL